MERRAASIRACGLGAFVALISCASGSAQQPVGIDFEAEDVLVDLRGGGMSFTNLSVSDGAVTVTATEGSRTNESGDDGIWEFRRGLRVTIDTALLTASEGTLRFAGGTITAMELLGDPVTLDAPAEAESSRLLITAGRIAYDGSSRLLRASDDVLFVSDGFRFQGCDWTYDFTDRSVEGLPQAGADRCRARISVNRPDAP